MLLYRALLYLYPAAFRNEYREEMCLVFSARRRNASGVLERTSLWLDVVADTLRNALQVQWDVLRQDLRYTTRSLMRAPGFAITAVVVTALGIGANTAVFSITDRVLIRPLPFADSERLVKLWENVPRYSRLEPSPANYRDWRDMSTVFESTAAIHMTAVNLVGTSEPLRLHAANVEPDLFALLGVSPHIGRALSAADAEDGAPDVVVLSYGVWQSVFGGRESVLGETVRLNGESATVVGVMPDTFRFPNRRTELWSVKRLRSQDFEDRDNNYLQVVAKLRPGATIEDARAEMTVITQRLEEAYPEENAKTRASVVSLRDEVTDRSRLLLMALFGASLCVLLIACANLANLLLARAMEGRKELTVRTALGGGAERLVRQLLTESLLLSTAGGVLGVLVASSLHPLLTRLVPIRLPIAESGTLDLRVLVFAALLTLVTAIGFGVLPAFRSSRGVDLTALREDARAGLGARRERLRSVLVVAQVTASVVLLVASGLLMQALWRVRAVDPGFQTEGIVALETPLPQPNYAETVRRAQFYDRVLTDVRSLPGVADAAYTSFVPMLMKGGIWPVRIGGITDGSETPETASLRFTTPGLFSTLGIPLRRGREVRNTDTFESPFVAVVSESFVERYWPDRDPLGQSFNIAFRDRIVVGVVADIRVRGLERHSEPQVYLPHQQVPDGGLVFYTPKELVIRAAGDSESFLPEVRSAIRRADPELPIAEVRSLEEVVGGETAPRSSQIHVLSVFAGLSLLLSGIGIYGLLSFAISRRRSEIGLRIALGARSSSVLRMVLREGAMLAVAGAVLGGLLAYAAGRTMEAILAGVRPGDAATYLIAAAVALAMTLAGSLVPAMRAVRVDPTTALRGE